MKCPVCGEENTMDYCSNCGFREKKCSECGSKVSWDDIKCTDCGCYIIQSSSDAFKERISKLKRLKPLGFLDKVFTLSCYEDFRLLKDSEMIPNRGTLRTILLSIDNDFEDLESLPVKVSYSPTILQNADEVKVSKVIEICKANRVDAMPLSDENFDKDKNNGENGKLSKRKEKSKLKSENTTEKDQVINLEDNDTFEDMDELIQSIVIERHNDKIDKNKIYEKKLSREITKKQNSQNKAREDNFPDRADEEEKTKLKTENTSVGTEVHKDSEAYKDTSIDNSPKNDYMTGVLNENDSNEESKSEKIYNLDRIELNTNKTKKRKKKKFAKKKIVFRDYEDLDYDGYYKDVKIDDEGKYVNESRKRIISEYKWVILGFCAAGMTGIFFIIITFL